MPHWLHWLQEWLTRDPVSQFNDPILGEIMLNESAWECAVNSPSGRITLRVGGRYEPDEALLESARQTFHNLPRFIDRVTDYLREESEHETWQEFAEEISALRINDVNYWWPRKPQVGMIFFKGPDECKIWHCDIDGSRLFGLAFDS